MGTARGGVSLFDVGASAPSAEEVFFDSLEPQDTFDYWPAMIRALDSLTPKQRFVIEMRYGLRVPPFQFTLSEVADVMGSTRQAVSRIEQRALARMRGLTE